MTTLHEQNSADRRTREPRHFQISLPLRYRVVGQKTWCDGQVIEISVAEILFKSDESIEVGKSIDLRVVLPGLRRDSAGGMIVRKAKVMRSWQIDEGAAEVFITRGITIRDSFVPARKLQEGEARSGESGIGKDRSNCLHSGELRIMRRIDSD